MELKVVNISIKNAIMSREFYWNRLGIDCLNETLSNAHRKPCNAQIFVPQMPLNTSPLHIVLDVKNLSMSDEKELKIFRRLECDCAMKRKGRNEHCPHRNVAEIRPACVKIKARQMAQLEVICRYELLGQHVICFVIESSSCRVKLCLTVTTIAFNPLSMLLTKELAPVAIDTFPAMQQALWFYNPYSVDIQLRLISYNTNLLLLTTDVIVVKSHEHLSAFVTFNPYHVGCFDIKLGIMFNECECFAHIHAECRTQCDTVQHFHSPKHNFPSQLNPFVLHSDNLCILMPQNGKSSENLIALENGSKACVEFEWKDLRLSDFSCEIRVEPREGCLRAGAIKLFRISVRSLGCGLKLQMIPLCCLIYRKCSAVSLPDGYFEYTEKGYYEKPQNQPSKHEDQHLTTLYMNLNVNVLNTTSAALAQQINNESCHMNVPMTTIINNNHEVKATLVCDANDDEKYMMETLISMIMCRRRYNGKFSSSYNEITQQMTKNSTEKFLPTLMNDILFESVTAIAREHRFIPSSTL